MLQAARDGARRLDGQSQRRCNQRRLGLYLDRSSSGLGLGSGSNPNPNPLLALDRSSSWECRAARSHQAGPEEAQETS